MIWLLPALAAGLLIARVFFGVDLSDESYHLATAYHFSKGARAFIDEVYVIQTFGFLTTPIFSFLVGPTGSLDSIVLKMRFAFLVFHFFVAASLFLVLKKRFGYLLAFLSSALFLLYVPMYLFSLFYVTLGVGFLALAVAFGDLAENHPNRKALLAFSGALAALATISHPVMLLPTAYFFLRAIWQELKGKDKKFFSILGMLGAFVGVWAITKLSYGFTVSAYLNSFKGVRPTIWNLERVLSIVRDMMVPGPLTIPLLLWLALFIKKVRPALLVLLFPGLIFFHCRASQGGPGPCGYLMLNFYFSPFFCHAYAPEFTKKFLLNFWIPGLLASLGLSFASLSGPSSTSAGFLPVLPLGIAFLLGIVEKQKGARTLLVLGLFAILFRGLWGTPFQETNLSSLTATVSSGPFKYLRTSVEKRNFLEEMQKTLRSALPAQGRIVFSCFFPGGYLMTNLMPNHTMLYTAPLITEIDPSTDIVVRVLDDAYPKLGLLPWHCAPLPELIAGSMGTLLRKEGYEIWSRKAKES